MIIVYTSKTGHTKAYAEMIGKQTGVKVMELSEALKLADKSESIVYLGWMMAGNVVGFDKAVKAFQIAAIGACGMESIDSQSEGIKKKYNLIDTPVFYLPGGYEKDKLHGILKIGMNIMGKTMIKKYEAKGSLTDNEKLTIHMFKEGQCLVDEEKTKNLVSFVNENK